MLLPRRRPGARAPLWQLRKRASDLLAVAARFGSFPIILETYRECLRDFFDLPALTDILTRARSRSLRVISVESQTPSPFSASLLFGYVANYLYDGDAPLAERRAQALSVDQSQLRDLIGDSELRDLLDEAALETLEQERQYLPERFHARSLDAVHDLLLRLGDLSAEEIRARSVAGVDAAASKRCSDRPAAIRVRVASVERLIAVEDALAVSRRAWRPAAARPARPRFSNAWTIHRRSGAPLRAHARAVHRRRCRGAVRHSVPAVVEAALAPADATGRVTDGEFRPGGHGREWWHADVLHDPPEVARQAAAGSGEWTPPHSGVSSCSGMRCRVRGRGSMACST